MRAIYALSGFSLLALVAAIPARGDTTLTGHFDNVTTGTQDGYDTSSGTYDIPADTGGTPSATFDNNTNNGIMVNQGTMLNMAGGEIDNNQDDGIYNFQGTVNITGGIISGNVFFPLVNNGGTVNIYGTFPGLTPGQVQDITNSPTITGTLENDSTPFSFKLDNDSNVYLHDVAVPEPASAGLLTVGAVGLLARRRRQPATK
jgi:hypothetical protein